MHIFRRRLAYTLAILAGLGAGGMWAIGSLLMQPTNSDVEAAAPPARSVEIGSTGSIRLAGTYWPTSSENSPAILMLHGNGSNRASAFETARWRNGRGYAVLAIDFRGHGQSSPARKSFGLFESDDAWAAVAWLRRQHPRAKIGVIGLSLGGAASLLGDRGPLEVDALVLEGVYPDIRHAIRNRLASRLGEWPATIIEPLLSYQSLPRFGVWPSRISPIKALPSFRGAVLIVGGGADINTPPEETRAMYEVAGAKREMFILDGAGHNDLGRPASGPFKQVLQAFLDRNLGVQGEHAR